MSVMYATVSTKGQVTIPAEIRQAHGISPGRRVGFRVEDGRVSLELPAAIDDVRSTLQQAMKDQGTLGQPYQNGDGWTAHVRAAHAQS